MHQNLPYAPMLATPQEEFRPIQYLGSKWRMRDAIKEQVSLLASIRRPIVCDLFAGTGVVARHLAHTSPVFAVDIQEYSRILTSASTAPVYISEDRARRLVDDARARLEHQAETGLKALISYEHAAFQSDDVEAVCGLVERGSLASETWVQAPDANIEIDQLTRRAAAEISTNEYGTMLRYYGGVYFSYQQAFEIDALANMIRNESDEVRDTLLAALLSTASELVSSIGGHFAQPMRLRASDGSIKVPLVASLARSRRLSALDLYEVWVRRYGRLVTPKFSVRAIRADYREAIESMPTGVGVVYADPPYTRDHYSRFYHVLETLAFDDDPGLTKVMSQGRLRPSRGLYRLDRHQSPFSIVSEAPGAFAELVAPLAQRSISLVLSYSPVPQTEKPRARVVGVEQLYEILSSYYRSVQTVQVHGISHAKMNTRRLNATKTYNAEVLFCCQP